MARLERARMGRHDIGAMNATKDRSTKLSDGRQNSGALLRYVMRGAAASAAVRTGKATARAQVLAPVIRELRAAGVSTLAGFAAGLNDRGHAAPRGGQWQAAQVRRLLAQIEGAA